jgi:aspartate ammonia-lyase
MLTRNEMNEFLLNFEMFRDLTEDERFEIIDLLDTKKYTKGEYLFEQNAERKRLFLIYKGDVELQRLNHLGQYDTLTYYHKNDFLGEGALMDNYPHSTAAKSITDSTILTLNRDDFYDLMRKNTNLIVKLISTISRIISRRMRQSATRVTGVASQYISGKTRLEHDLLGYREVPDESYYGIQTLRAMENFNITGVPISLYPNLIVATAQVKLAAALANYDSGDLDETKKNAIVQACEELIRGRFHIYFVVDLLQGGAGTSTNMNANEVIANRALEIMGYAKGEYEHCHPNSDVNMSQSTNDVYPTALKLAVIYNNQKLVAALVELVDSFRAKAKEFANVIKMGRTQLQDAVPMTLGQEFEAYAVTLNDEVKRLNTVVKHFLNVNMGGTAIGTGLNADKAYRESIIGHMRTVTGLEINAATNLVESTQDTGVFVMYSSAIKRLAIKLSKICNDLRLLSSGPRAGFNEINLPPMQPGSSIMPGKVNPVIPEVVNQIAYQVIGSDLTITLAAEAGQLELNVMEPVIAKSLFEMAEILSNGMTTLKYKCIDGITANEEVCRRMVENSIGIVTALNPILGYEICTDLAKEAMETNGSVYELVLKRQLMSKEELDRVLSPMNMV